MGMEREIDLMIEMKEEMMNRPSLRLEVANRAKEPCLEPQLLDDVQK
jgi:hypothetical protein